MLPFVSADPSGPGGPAFTGAHGVGMVPGPTRKRQVRERERELVEVSKKFRSVWGNVARILTVSELHKSVSATATAAAVSVSVSVCHNSQGPSPSPSDSAQNTRQTVS